MRKNFLPFLFSPQESLWTLKGLILCDHGIVLNFNSKNFSSSKKRAHLFSKFPLKVPGPRKNIERLMSYKLFFSYLSLYSGTGLNFIHPNAPLRSRPLAFQK